MSAVERWTPRRKQEVVALIVTGRLTPEEAQEQHRISEEELAAWLAGRIFASCHGRVSPAKHLETIRMLRNGLGVAEIVNRVHVPVPFVYRLRKALSGAQNAHPRAPIARLLQHTGGQS